MSKSLSMFVLLGLLFACASATAKTPAQRIPTPKAQSPVSVSIQPAATPESGKPVDITVTASVKFSVENLTIQVQTPPGMTLNSGSLSWSGSIDRDQPKSITFNASFADRPNQTVIAKALVQGRNNARFAARDQYTVNPSAPNPAAQNAAAGRSRTVKRGTGSVVEYPLQ